MKLQALGNLNGGGVSKTGKEVDYDPPVIVCRGRLMMRLYTKQKRKKRAI